MRLALLILMLLVMPTRPVSADDPFDDAMDALLRLHAENVRLQAENDALRDAGELRLVQALTDQAVFVQVDEPDVDVTHVWSSDGTTLKGFNAAFVYDEPGTYMIDLDGKAHTRVVVGARSELLIRQLPAGEVRGPIVARAGELILGHPDPHRGTIITGPSNRHLIDATAGNVTVRGVTFRHDDLAGKDGMCVRPGDGLAVIDCTIERAANVIVTDFGYQLDGLYFAGNRQVGTDTIRRYGLGLFGDSTNVVATGNTFNNSNDEHIFRLSGAYDRTDYGGTRFVSVTGNDLSNLSERNGGPPRDMGKSAVILQVGAFAYVGDNRLVGANGVGPLPRGPESIRSKDTRFRVARWENNVVEGTMQFDHGAEHVRYVGGSITSETANAVEFHGGSAEHGRSLVDVVMEDFVITGKAGHGSLLRVWPGAQPGEITFRNGRVEQVGQMDGQGWMPPIRMESLTDAVLEDIVATRVPAGTWGQGSVVLAGSQNEKTSYKQPGDLRGVMEVER